MKTIGRILSAGLITCVGLALFTTSARATGPYLHFTSASACAVSSGAVTRTSGQVSNLSSNWLILDCPLYANGSYLSSIYVDGWANNAFGMELYICSVSPLGPNSCGAGQFTVNGLFSTLMTDTSKYSASAGFNYLHIVMSQTGVGSNDLYGYDVELGAQ